MSRLNCSPLPSNIAFHTLVTLALIFQSSFPILISLRLRLDVDIGALGIELVSMPNQTSIDIGLQYQSHCLDADEIAIDGIKEQANTDSCLDVHTCGI